MGKKHGRRSNTPTELLKQRIRELEKRAAKLSASSKRRALQEIQKLKNQVEEERWLTSPAPNGA